MLAEMVPAILVTEARGKDAVRRMGWVRRKKQGACWKAGGAVNLAKIELPAPAEGAEEHAELGKPLGIAEISGVEAVVCLACPTHSLSYCTPRILKERRRPHPLHLGLCSSSLAW